MEIGKNHRPIIDIVTRILNKVDGDLHEDKCWNFTGAKDRRGYGFIASQRTADGKAPSKKHRVIRVMWEAYNGEPIPTRMLVRHTCDNPSCCNPHHLMIGTHQDNSDDKFARGWAHFPGRGNKIKAQY